MMTPERYSSGDASEKAPLRASRPIRGIHCLNATPPPMPQGMDCRDLTGEWEGPYGTILEVRTCPLQSHAPVAHTNTFPSQLTSCGGDCLIGWQTIPGLPPEAPCKRPWCMRRVHGNCFCQPFYFTSQNTAYEGVPGCCAVDYEVRRLSEGRISRSAVSV